MTIYRQIVLFQTAFAQILGNSKRTENQTLNKFLLFEKNEATAKTNELHFAIRHKT